jgi:transposase InsO family protein
MFFVVFIDFYSRRIVDWAADTNIIAELVTRTLLMEIWNRKPSKGLIIHTDQGSQYISNAYLLLLKT